MKLLGYCNKIIEFSFYALFFLVPLVFSGDTSELFELNKMWLTFGITAIVGLAWGTKMIVEKKIHIQRTPLDIVLLLFLLSQVISSIFTLDQHVSWWGYYSRFNGGLLSTISYILLYYAFVTNLPLKVAHEKIKFSWSLYATGLGILAVSFLIILAIGGTDPGSVQTRPFFMGVGMIAALIFFIWSFRGPILYKMLFITFNAGLLTASWAFPAHFGFDPTCQLFQGNFNVSCWTEAFQPKDRTFSTLGQPAWLAAYMAMLIPLAVAYALRYAQRRHIVYFAAFSALSVLFYISLLFTNTRAGFIGFWIANLIFWAVIFIKQLLPRKPLLKAFALFNIAFFICNFFFNTPIGQLNTFTLSQLNHHTVQAPPETLSGAPLPTVGGITDSGDIRLLVWNGAVKTWQNNPIFGTGVETFAYDYYKYKSPAHNLTSEWDYLYNKAHNEYLNYLATTGLFGLGTYLAFLALFLFLTTKWLWSRNLANNMQQTAFVTPMQSDSLTIVGLVTGWLTILITNFFGFSVVIMNLYLFLIPLFVFILAHTMKEDHAFVFPKNAAEAETRHTNDLNPYQWTGLILIVIMVGWMEIGLIWYRQADIAYAYGNNLDKTGSYGQATKYLLQASQMVGDEPVYKDELAINLGAIAAGLFAQKDTKNGDQVAQAAIADSTDVVTNHPNNVVYWKNRVRLFYTLSSSDPVNQEADMTQAIKAIDTAKDLAPTDAKVSYNQAILYGQVGQTQQAVSMLENTIKLKADYTDAYVALGIFYHQLAIDKNGKVIKPDMQQKAIQTYEYILKNLDPNNKDVKKSLEQWRSDLG